MTEDVRLTAVSQRFFSTFYNTVNRRKRLK